MTLTVYTNLDEKEVSLQGGIGQVVKSLYRHLPSYGVRLVHKASRDVDLYTSHIMRGELPRIDIVHSHGLYFSDVPHLEYRNWHHNANLDIVGSVRNALVVTVPSNWVAMPFKRDMRINPIVLGHGIDLAHWEHSEKPQGYILYNKNRESDVCQSLPAWELAHAGCDVISTFAPAGKSNLPNMKVTGVLPHVQMTKLIQSASVYLATTLETFGIGTLEALASGIPVLGYRWGGNEDLVTHKVNGYMAEPNDIQDLIAGYEWIMDNWQSASENAKLFAQKYDWSVVAQRYAMLYRAVVEGRQHELENSGVSIIITNYNYAHWVEYAISSAVNQSVPPKEIIVVDDGSKDNSREVINGIVGRYSGKIPIKKIFQENMGVAYARNKGISVAESPFVTCLDADDMIHPDFVKTLMPALEKDRGLGIVYSGLQFINDKNILGAKSNWPPEFDYDTQITPRVPPSNMIPSGCMFRKSMWARAGGYRQEYAPGEDTEFWVRGLSVGFDAKKVTDRALFLYRGHQGSASRTKKYRRIDDKMPWMRDGVLPMGAPSKRQRAVRSYLNPSISVIIPVGNGHEKYVHFAIESVLGQTMREWELILVNDTDIPEKEFEERFARFPFLKILHTELKDGKRSNGAGTARNLGLDHAKGSATFFLDADDVLITNALAKHWEALLKLDFNRYIYAGHMLVRENEQIEEHIPEEYRQGQWRMQHSVSVLIPTEWARELRFDESLYSWEDWDFFIRTAIKGYCGYKIEGAYLVYRLESGKRRKSIMLSDKELNPRGKLILSELKKRYDKYYTGGQSMAGCCGGTKVSDEILRVKRILNGKSAVKQEDKGAVNMAKAKAVVRLEYIGRNMGAIGMKVPSGRIYRGGRGNPRDRYVNAAVSDVDYLLNTGKWRVVGNLPPAQPEDKQEDRQLTAEEVRQSAVKNLESAKKDFEAREGVIKPEEDVATRELQKRIDEATKKLQGNSKDKIDLNEIDDEDIEQTIEEKFDEILAPKIEINRARIQDLTKVSGISEQMALDIVAGQPYSEMKELLKISGIGKSKLALLEKHFGIDNVD